MWSWVSSTVNVSWDSTDDPLAGTLLSLLALQAKAAGVTAKGHQEARVKETTALFRPSVGYHLAPHHCPQSCWLSNLCHPVSLQAQGRRIHSQGTRKETAAFTQAICCIHFGSELLPSVMLAKSFVSRCPAAGARPQDSPAGFTAKGHKRGSRGDRSDTHHSSVWVVGSSTQVSCISSCRVSGWSKPRRILVGDDAAPNTSGLSLDFKTGMGSEMSEPAQCQNVCSSCKLANVCRLGS